MKDQQIIVEEPDKNKAEQLYLSGEWCQPRYSDKRDCYILIKKTSALLPTDDRGVPLGRT